MSVAYVLPLAKPEAAPLPEIHVKPKPRARKQAWLALHFNDWPLHAVLKNLAHEQRIALSNQPLAVLDQDRQRRVLACNDAALARGIRIGHTLNSALALCAELQLLSRDVAAETKLLTAMAEWAQCYTPIVSIEPPNELLLEVRGSLHLFGGVQGLIAHIQQALQERQLSARVALSSTVRASLWLSRVVHNSFKNNSTKTNSIIVTPRQLKSMLAALPLHCLHWPMELQLRLARFGVTQLGELWRLPRGDLARRIGAKYLQELDVAVGRQIELRQSFKSVMSYVERVLLDFEITNTLLLQPVLLGCLKRLQRYLREHDLAIGRLHVELLHREQLPTRFYIGLATPTSDMERVVSLLHEQLSRMTLPEPVLEIKLRVKQLLATQGRSCDLLSDITQAKSGQAQMEMLGHLLERLQVRLGSAAVRILQLQADHRPEDAQTSRSADLEIKPTAVMLPTMMIGRPLWLLQQPSLLCVGVKPPQELRLLQGPERIEAGWWNDAPLKRDYYVARCPDQSWCWVFRELLHAPGWYLHGWFA